VYDIAQRTYQSLDATAQVYQRFADNADRLGLSQQKVAELTETVSKAVAISGASATAAQAALTQFGQALASGQLRGEELNSVMEQTPALAKAIADGMGVSVGELRKKAQDGEMTIEKVIQALERAAD
ncbi:tape measure protein, partial [Escherichia coli]|uniref:tape measure protein n=2 Tax=Enterobacterales TaxID=91347 RepID=UPI0019D221DD